MIILATHNPGKIAEFKDYLPNCEMMSQAELGLPEVEETGLCFVENALIKARYASLKTQLPALADDSGLVVPALGGAPGIYSARYAKKHGSQSDNMSYLLSQMSSLRGASREAYFYCVLVLMRTDKDPTPVIVTGTWHGMIQEQPAGEQGFGYDPIFYIPSLACTAAQLPIETKNILSHRGQALAQLRQLGVL